MPGLRITLPGLLVCAAVSFAASVSLPAQERAPLGTRIEKLKASRIEARSLRGLRSLRPMYGLPELSFNNGSYDRNSREAEPERIPTNIICGHSFAEKIGFTKRVWMSTNLDFNMPNWVAWDLDPFEPGDSLDRFSPVLRPFFITDSLRLKTITEDAPRNAAAALPDSRLLASVLEECRKWALEKPVGGTSVVCGPLVHDELSHLPYQYFVVVCKKTGKGLGYKSIGFLIPAVGPAGAAEEGKSVNPYSCSTSVNTIEHKSGYDFFFRLPEGVQEHVEGMTTFELFCSYVEESAYNEEAPDSDNDAMDALNDYLLDFYDR